MKANIYGLLDDNGVVHEVKGLSEVYKGKSKRGVTLVQVAVFEVKNADKTMICGGIFRVTKLFSIY